MLQSPAYQPLFDQLIEFVSREEYRSELLAGRSAYIQATGEAFEDDRSFEARLQGFLDWFIFDRPLNDEGEPPVRVYANRAGIEPSERLRFVEVSRTIHGIFSIEKVKDDFIIALDLLTRAKYRLPRHLQILGLNKGDLFESRLVPYEGGLHFSMAFLFYPPFMKRRIMKEAQRTAKLEQPLSVQELIFTLARMAARAEHYRNIDLDDIFDFERPPPKVASVRLQFDAAAVTKRLSDRTPLSTKRAQSLEVLARK